MAPLFYTERSTGDIFESVLKQLEAHSSLIKELQVRNGELVGQIRALKEEVGDLRTKCAYLEAELRDAQFNTPYDVNVSHHAGISREPAGYRTSSSHRQAISIPLEIAEIIIDHLHFDTKALKACSLVCRGWVPSSRYHLFESWQGDSTNYERAITGMQLLRHPLCTFSSSLRRLIFIRKMDGKIVPLIWNHFSTDILRLSPISSLDVVGYKLTDRQESLALAGAASYYMSSLPLFDLGNITHLRLRNVYSDRVSFMNIVCGLNRLQRLHLMNLQLVDAFREDSVVIKVPESPLKVVEVMDSSPWIWIWLQAIRLPTVQNLRMSLPADAQSLSPISVYLALLGSSLSLLGIRVEPSVLYTEQCSSPMFLHSLNLQVTAAALETFEISGLFQFDGYRFNQVYKWLSIILEAIPGCLLRTLILFVDIWDPLTRTTEIKHFYDEGAWEGIDTLLTSSRFPVLSRIVFRVENDAVYNEIVPNHIRERLPGCWKRKEMLFQFD